MAPLRLATAAMLALMMLTGCQAADTTVTDTDSLRAALRQAAPGTRVLLAPGEYAGGMYLENLHGQEGQPVTIASADPANPARLVGVTECLHLTEVSYVELRDLVFTGASGNGVNIDDGGTFGTPAHHVVLERVTITDIGPNGNHDGLKLSGLDDFVVKDCTFERWGDGGSGIDMVGCHRGRIEGCTFRARATGSSEGVQTKGGTRDILIRSNKFDHVGGRAINIGGSTGLQFFRPKVEGFDARDITVEGNVFVGAIAPLAFVGVDGAVARFNTLYLPEKWALRILQETTAEGFVPCRNGVLTDNLIVFRSDRWAEGGCNIGPGTVPETFRFERNLWYCEDRPERSRPALPSPEVEGVYGVDPRLADPAHGDFTPAPDGPAARYGHTALPHDEQ